MRHSGIEPIATELAKRDLSLAGFLQYFMQNWEKITQDQWVLDALRGYAIPFTQRQHQPCHLTPLHHSSEDEQLLQDEVMVEKTITKGRGFLSIFLMPKKDGGQRLVINDKLGHIEHF